MLANQVNKKNEQKIVTQMWDGTTEYILFQNKKKYYINLLK